MSRVLRFLLVLIAVPFLTAQAVAATTSVSARLSEEGHYLVDLFVGGEGPYTFIVDTAAQTTVVLESFAQAAGLADANSGQRIMVHGASGMVEARLVTLGLLESGDWAFDAGTAVVIPDVPHLSDIDRIIGAGVLFQQPVGFNAANGTLDIYSSAPSFDPALELGGEWMSVAAQSRDATSFLWANVEINGVPFDAVIDTGARRSAINLAGSAALGYPDPVAAGLEEDEPIRGASHDFQAAWVLPVESITLSDMSWTDIQLSVSDLAVFRMIGRADQPTVILGADLLARGYFIVDAPGERLWFPAAS